MIFFELEEELIDNKHELQVMKLLSWNGKSDLYIRLRIH